MILSFPPPKQWNLKLGLVSDVVARQIIKAVLTSDDENDMVRGMNLTQELSTRLQQVCDVSKALEVLLVSLELDRGKRWFEG